MFNNNCSTNKKKKKTEAAVNRLLKSIAVLPVFTCFVLLLMSLSEPSTASHFSLITRSRSPLNLSLQTLHVMQNKTKKKGRKETSQKGTKHDFPPRVKVMLVPGGGG